MTSYGEKFLFLFGGWDARSAKYFGDLWRFDTQNMKWVQLLTENQNRSSTN
jgi:hypothetical protein